MSTTAAFVMTYQRPQTLAATLRELLAQSRSPERILVVDNGADPATEAVASKLESCGVGYLAMPDNLGPAGAAAAGLEALVAEGWDWIYWGDDDDPPKTRDTLERVLALAERGKIERLAGVGAVGTRWDWSRGRFDRLADAELEGAVEVDSIAGGQHLMLRREVVMEVGLPAAELFFGLEELEYCLRFRQAGWRLAVDGELMYRYRELAGRLALRRRRTWIPQIPSRALWRRYYSTRNYIFMMRNTFGRPDLARREALKSLARTVTAWGRGPRYGAAFAGFQLRGILDAYRGRMGRVVAPRIKEM